MVAYKVSMNCKHLTLLAFKLLQWNSIKEWYMIYTALNPELIKTGRSGYLYISLWSYMYLTHFKVNGLLLFTATRDCMEINCFLFFVIFKWIVFTSVENKWTWTWTLFYGCIILVISLSTVNLPQKRSNYQVNPFFSFNFQTNICPDKMSLH